MQRSINGPERDWLSLDEIAAYTGIGSPTLQQMINSGNFPQGTKHSARIVKWSWLDVVAYMHLASKMELKFTNDKRIDDE